MTVPLPWGVCFRQEKGTMCVYSVSGSQLGLFCGGYFSLKLLLCIKSTRDGGLFLFLACRECRCKTWDEISSHGLPPFPVPCSSCGLGLLDGLPWLKNSLRGRWRELLDVCEKPKRKRRWTKGGSGLSCLLKSAIVQARRYLRVFFYAFTWALLSREQLVGFMSLAREERAPCLAQGYLQAEYQSFHCSLIGDPSVRPPPCIALTTAVRCGSCH